MSGGRQRISSAELTWVILLPISFLMLCIILTRTSTFWGRRMERTVLCVNQGYMNRHGRMHQSREQLGSPGYCAQGIDLLQLCDKIESGPFPRARTGKLSPDDPCVDGLAAG